MIRFLQSEGQTKKYVLGGLLLLICLSMVAYLTQGISSSGGLAGSTKGVVATVGGDQITAQEVVDQGRAMLQDTSVTTRSGTVAITGGIDLPAASAELRLALRPALEGAPEIGLRLSGRLEALTRTPELANLTRWRAEHAP